MRHRTILYFLLMSPRSMASNCVMHTYFQFKTGEKLAEQKANNETMSSWRRAWEASGWKTRVLTEKHAKDHPDYASLSEAMYSYPTVLNKQYEYACFIRHVSMAAVGGGWMSDYDVIPLDLPSCAEPTNGGIFTTHQRFIPALISGSAEEYTRVSTLLAKLPWRDNPKIFQANGRTSVSDMLGFAYLSSAGLIKVYPQPDATSRECGLIDAAVFFDRPTFNCFRVCSRHSYISGSEITVSDRGPMGLHLSHRQVKVMSAALRGGASSSLWFTDFFPSELLSELKDLTNERFHRVRGSILEITPAIYKKNCQRQSSRNNELIIESVIGSETAKGKVIDASKANIESSTFQSEVLKVSRPGLRCGQEQKSPILIADSRNHGLLPIEFYNATMSRRTEELARASKHGNILLTDLRGDVRLIIEKEQPNMIWSSAWNSTYQIPADPRGKRPGGALVWAFKPTGILNEESCTSFSSKTRDLVVIANWYPGNFGHFVRDTLPVLYWVKRFRSLPSSRFGLIDDDVHRLFLEWFDPDLYERVEWISLGRLMCFLKTGQSTEGPKPNLRAAQYFSALSGVTRSVNWNMLDSGALVENLVHEIELLRPALMSRSKDSGSYESTVIFYSSSLFGDGHRTTLSTEHENELLEIIDSTMKQFQRPERLVVFTGYDAKGNAYGYQEQYEAFQSASLVIGSQSTGMSNLLWMLPSLSDSCKNVPAVIEFLCGDDTKKSQRGCLGRSFWNVMGGAPWIRFYHLFFLPKDPLVKSFYNLQIDPEELKTALKKIWSQ